MHADVSSFAIPPNAPSCPTCGKQMTLRGIVPTSEGTIYDYLCGNDGDRLSWQPRRKVQNGLVARPGHDPQRAAIGG